MCLLSIHIDMTDKCLQCTYQKAYRYMCQKRLITVSKETYQCQKRPITVKAKIALSFASPEKEKYFLFIYEVITLEKRKKALLITTPIMSVLRVILSLSLSSLYVYIYECMYLYVCVYIYTHIYIHTHELTLPINVLNILNLLYIYIYIVHIHTHTHTHPHTHKHTHCKLSRLM